MNTNSEAYVKYGIASVVEEYKRRQSAIHHCEACGRSIHPKDIVFAHIDGKDFTYHEPCFQKQTEA